MYTYLSVLFIIWIVGVVLGDNTKLASASDSDEPNQDASGSNRSNPGRQRSA